MAYRILYQYNWPGNVRELKNVIERVLVTTDADIITAEALPMYQPQQWSLQYDGEQLPMKERMEKIEYGFIMDAYERFHSVRKAAVFLKMSVTTFVRKRSLYEDKFGIQK